MNQVLYVSSLVSSQAEAKILAMNPSGIGLQIQKYHRLLAKGFVKNGVDVHTLSYHMANKPLHGAEEEENGVHYHYIFPSGSGKLSYLSVLKQSYSRALEFFKKNKQAVMACDALNFTVSLGAALAARKMKRQVVGILTDFPQHVSEKMDLHARLIWLLVKLCTSYVVLTEQMKEALDPRKPAAVLEGHVDMDEAEESGIPQEKVHPRICVYAGGLHRKYGIEKLVKAFQMASVDDAVLYIYGNGDYVDELREMQDDRIKYWGIVPNQTVVEIEKQATLLINPRPADEEFTKYSFPSKNMEYMVSGTAVLTTCLPGMPTEYHDYVYLFDEETVEAMAQTLQTVLSKTDEELSQKGQQAKQFVLAKKNNAVQAKTILDMCQSENG